MGMALPRDSAISGLNGLGLGLDWRAARRLWLTASVNWLTYDLMSTEIKKKHHVPHHSPPHQSPDYKLIKVESTQRQQHYSLGLQYRPSLRGWLRPTVGIAHTWVRHLPAYVSYRFKDKGHGGPDPGPGGKDDEYVLQRTEAAWLANVWRFHAGVEHERPRWVFSLGADFAKSFEANEPLFSSLLGRAGVAYKF
jgi:hypothetical protein